MSNRARKTLVVLSALTLFTNLSTLSCAAHGDKRKSLVLEEAGSFFVGGQPFHTQTGNSTNATDPRNPGTVTINQTYVEYLIPEDKEFKTNVIMMPGGGHSQKVFETTPDGREGWATYFPRKGFATYLSDGVNRGSSSWDMTNIALVRQGVLPVTAIPAIDRYTYETAWVNFRIGPSYGVQHPGGQFPVKAFSQYVNQLVPAFRDPIETEKNIAALVAVLDRVGPSVIVAWSQSGAFALNAGIQRPKLVKGMVLLDSGSGNTAAQGFTAQQKAAIAHIPILALDADFRDAPTTTAEVLGGKAQNIWLPKIGIRGNGHAMMVEKNNLKVADVIIDWIKKKVEKPRKR